MQGTYTAGTKQAGLCLCSIELGEIAMQLTIDLSDQQLKELDQQARSLGVTPEELARAALIDLVSPPDAEFEQIAGLVLGKNKELYDRLK
jgi:hypothetical protein